MKVIHLCLASFYIDGYGYQENILPRMHKKQGHDVLIIASTETFVDNATLGYVNSGNYVNEDGIEVHRLSYNQFIPSFLVRKLRVYNNIYQELENFKPDIIFMHDLQFLSIKSVARYMKNNRNAQLFIDGHTDFINSARGFISKFILHGIIYKQCVKIISPYVKKYYGTLPARVDFFTDFYGTPKEKTFLLPMGADDEYVALAKDKREVIRAKHNVKKNDFLVVTGGKFSSKKSEVVNLIKAVIKLSNESEIKLLVFGSLESGAFENEILELCDGNIVQHVGWLKSNDVYEYFEASDIVVFPGSHSVLWEQAVGQGKPCLFNYMKGFTHIDLGGNCRFLVNNEVNEIMNKLKSSIEEYEEMKEVAQNEGLKSFSYYNIAQWALK